MRSPIELRRTLEVEEWRVNGTIAFAVKRQWEPAVLKLAVHDGQVTEESVATHLLAGRRSLAKRLLALCSGLGLLQAQGGRWVATEAGRIAADTELVFLPERRTWKVYVCGDSLLPAFVLGVERASDGSAWDDRNRDSKRQFPQVPARLEAGVTAASVIGANELRIDDIAPNGEHVASERNLEAHLVVSEPDVRLHLRGRCGGHPVDASLQAPRLQYELVWRDLLRSVHLESAWDQNAGALRVSLQQATELERGCMMRDLQVPRPVISALGAFESVRVANVPLRPSSREEATKWAKWRLLNSLTSYVHEPELPQLFRDAAAAFSDLKPECPSLRELAAEARSPGRPPPRYWHLQALSDWSVAAGRES